jgi:hypothetical protein
MAEGVAGRGSCTGLCYLLQLERMARELGISANKDKVANISRLLATVPHNKSGLVPRSSLSGAGQLGSGKPGRAG